MTLQTSQILLYNSGFTLLVDRSCPAIKLLEVHYHACRSCLLTAPTGYSNIIRAHPCDRGHIRAAHRSFYESSTKNLMSTLGDRSPNTTFTRSKCFTLLVGRSRPVLIIPHRKESSAEKLFT